MENADIPNIADQLNAEPLNHMDSSAYYIMGGLKRATRETEYGANLQ